MEHGKVIKSKSSNSAITSKYPVRSHGKPAKCGGGGSKNKKSWSSSAFQASAFKKRGVYVEKKSTNVLNAQPAAEDSPRLNRSPLRSRRPMTASTTKPSAKVVDPAKVATTCDLPSTDPDAWDDIQLGKPHKVLRRVGVPTVEKGTQDLDALYHSPRASPLRNRSPVTSTGRQLKFRSRVLTENAKAEEKLVVLQPKKDLGITPSTYSETPMNSSKKSCPLTPQSLPRASLPQLPPFPPVLEQELNSIYLNSMPIANDDAAQVPKKLKKAKVLRIEEPTTLVSDYQPKENKSLTNFFIDLMETNLSAYNIDQMSSAKSEYNDLTIDETIIKMLDLPEKRRAFKITDSNLKGSNQKLFTFKEDDGSTDKIQVYKIRSQYANMNPPNLKRPRVQSCGFRNNLRSTSYAYNSNRYRSHSPKTQSLIKLPKKQNNNNKKATLLNLLIEELQMDEDEFEEPQTMHQALRIIAKNKRRCRRYIHFDEPKKTDIGEPDCMFKRRKIISPSNKSTKTNKKFGLYNPRTTLNSIKTSLRKFSTTTDTNYRKDDEYPKSVKHTASYRSLEVCAYDYEPNQIIRYFDDKHKTILYAFNSVESLPSESINSSKHFLKYESHYKKASPIQSTIAVNSSLNNLFLDYEDI